MKPDFFYPKIRMHCNSVPSLIMDSYIVDVVREVCTKSQTNVEYVSVPVTAGTPRYNLNKFLDSYQAEVPGVSDEVKTEEVCAIRSKRITFDDSDGATYTLEAASEDAINGAVTDMQGREGRPTHFFLDISPHQLRIYPTPDVNGTLNDILAVTRPRKDVLLTDDNAAVPFEIYNNFEELVAMGAAAHLLRMPKKPWSNFTVGQRMRKDYMAALAELRRDVRSSRVRENKRVRMPSFT